MRARKRESWQDDLLEGLNEAQREAVTWPGGPLLVLAGAGSGKTRVLAYRIAWLIANGVPAGGILAVTFTNKAAGEMAQRVEDLLRRCFGGGRPGVGGVAGDGAGGGGGGSMGGGGEVGDGGDELGRQVWMGTFHAVCVRILRAHAGKIGYGNRFGIADADDQAQLVRAIVRDLGVEETHKPGGVLAVIGRAKDQLVTPGEYLARARGFWEEKTGEIYRLYQERLRESDLMDFDDLLLNTVRLFRDHPGVLEGYARRFRHILVDEFQDTNRVQYILLQQLASYHGNLTVVGDDDQSIYGFRGADLRNILDFEQDFPGTHVVRLEQNYRSTQVILDAAHSVIKRSRSRKGKRLWTERRGGAPVFVYRAENEHDEARFIVREAERLVEREGYRLSDVTVLYRTHAQSRVLEEAFLRRGVAYVVVGSVHFYQRKEVKDVLAYLRASLNPRDDVSTERIINVPRRGIGEETVRRLRDFARRQGIGLREAAARPAEAGLGKAACRRVEEFAKLLDEVERRLTLPVHEVIGWVLEHTGYLAELRAERTREAEDRIENLRELVNSAVDFSLRSPDYRAEAFLAEVALFTSVDVTRAGGPAVTLMTLHAAKGLEFPVVFLAGLEEGVFPHSRSFESEDELDEERRLCYVGMTRARDRLYLTHSRYRELHGGRVKPSRFLEEVPQRLVEELASPGEFPDVASGVWHGDAADVRSASPAGRGERGRADEALLGENGRLWRGEPLAPGQKVRHPRFGTGVVLSCRGEGEDAEVKVAFYENGIRTLVARYARLDLGGAQE
ncbi:MAG: 3'-5' exonuclease [Bacillota bacterium]|nr:3'-5' exonuclease [Bacillota bacterium]